VIAVGQPIDENPTGIMMEAAFADAGLHWRYQLIEAAPDQLSDVVRGIRAMGIAGANFTIPHKQAVIGHLDGLAPSARIIGAVNTVVVEGDKLIGHNTDGQGFLRALKQDAKTDPSGKVVTIIGAGGAARAILVELALAGAAKITLVNRTVGRASQVIDEVGSHLDADLQVAELTEGMIIPPETNILVNATSIGLYPSKDSPPVDSNSIRPGMVVVDVIPNPPNTTFLQRAGAAGASTLTGLGMLVHQGAIAFELWTGMRAPVDAMYGELQHAFQPDSTD